MMRVIASFCILAWQRVTCVSDTCTDAVSQLGRSYDDAPSRFSVGAATFVLCLRVLLAYSKCNFRAIYNSP